MRVPLLLRPRWLGIHLLALLVVLTCTLFGYWQYERAQRPDRETVTNPVADLAAAVDISTLLRPGEYMPQDLANEAVVVTGTYDAEHQLLSPALSPDGAEGYSVVIPLVTEDGVAVAVNRGWIPLDAADEVPPPPDGEVTVRGWLQLPQDEASRGYSAILPEGQIARISSALLVNEWPYQLYEGYVTLGEQSPPTPAGAGSALEEFPPPDPPQGIVWNFRNLSYAAQWWVFGLAAIVFWVSLMRRELDDHRKARQDGGAAAEGPAEPAQPSAEMVAD